MGNVIQLPKTKATSFSCWQKVKLFILYCMHRKAFIRWLKGQDCEIGIHMWLPWVKEGKNAVSETRSYPTLRRKCEHCGVVVFTYILKDESI